MARPKGSKNRTSLTADAYAMQITEAEKLKQTLDGEITGVLDAISQQKTLLKAKRREAQRTDRLLLALRDKRDQVLAAEAVRSQRAEIETAVAGLLASGQSVEDILNRLR